MSDDKEFWDKVEHMEPVADDSTEPRTEGLTGAGSPDSPGES